MTSDLEGAGEETVSDTLGGVDYLSDSKDPESGDPSGEESDPGGDDASGADESGETDTRGVEPAASDGWRYLVVAGAFMQEEYAKDQARRLRADGFEDAEVVVFDLSQYYSVIVGRYATLLDARRVERKLKAAGVPEVYVQRKRSSRG